MTKYIFRYKGGKGSGHKGHKGRPGEQGGSLPDNEYTDDKSSYSSDAAHAMAVNFLEEWLMDNALTKIGGVDEERAVDALYAWANKVNIPDDLEFPEEWDNWLDEAIQNVNNNSGL